MSELDELQASGWSEAILLRNDKSHGTEKIAITGKYKRRQELGSSPTETWLLCDKDASFITWNQRSTRIPFGSSRISGGRATVSQRRVPWKKPHPDMRKKSKLYQRILQAARTRFSLRHAVKTKYRKAPERVLFSCPKKGDTLGVFNTVAGQGHIISYAVVAAAGGHNMLMIGEPGCGKSMIAQRLPTILPVMSEESILPTLCL